MQGSNKNVQEKSEFQRQLAVKDVEIKVLKSKYEHGTTCRQSGKESEEIWHFLIKSYFVSSLS